MLSRYLRFQLFSREWQFSFVHARFRALSSDNQPEFKDKIDGASILWKKGYKNRNLNWYETKLDSLVKKKKLQRALQLEIDMNRLDNVEPSYYIYHKLISLCAVTGYVDKAYRLYKQMKQRCFTIKAKTYTSLFNACAESPDKMAGLGKAHYFKKVLLEEIKQDKVKDMNVTTYKAIIKAFGRCGDIHSAFLAMDEAIEKFGHPNQSCFNALLHACIEQKQRGFVYAVRVWQHMADMRIKPDIQLVNLFLRSVRDCSSTSSDTKLVVSGMRNDTLLGPGQTVNELTVNGEVFQNDKLQLFGGLEGFLSSFMTTAEKPDLKTLSLLVQLCPPGKDEILVIHEANRLGITLDVTFFNMLIVKMNKQKRFEEARNVALRTMLEHKVRPNLHTYGSLALGCFEISSAKEILSELEAKNCMPSIELFNILLINSRMNFSMKEYLLKQITRNGLKPTKNTISIIEKSIIFAKNRVLDNSRGRKKHTKLDTFTKFYLDWLRKTPVELTDDTNPFTKIEKDLEKANQVDLSSSDDQNVAVEFVEDFKKR